MDAWNKANFSTNKKKAASLNYSKWDSIVDSDDEEEKKSKTKPTRRAAPAGGPLGEVPQHLKAAYARVAMAQESGDEKGAMAAMRELELGLQAMPSDFKKALEPWREAAAPPPAPAVKAAAAPALDDVQSQLDKLEQAQAGLQAMTDDPSKMAEHMPEWLQSVGISREEIEAAETAPNSEQAMMALAQRAMANTLGGGAVPSAAAALAASKVERTKTVSSNGTLSAATGNSVTGGGPRGETAEVRRAREALEAQQRQLEQSQANLAAQQRDAEIARDRVAKAQAAFSEAEAKKEAQGKKVDSSIEDARADLHRQAVEAHQAAEQRAAVVNDLRERGNTAMRNGDPTAAREFYTQALSVPSVPSDERAKLLGNRAACLTRLNRIDLALIDAEEACECKPDWGKAFYRLGCLRADATTNATVTVGSAGEHGGGRDEDGRDAAGAFTALETAASLLGDSANSAALDRAQALRESQEARRCNAVAMAGGPVDGPKARAASRLWRADDDAASASAAVAAAARVLERTRATMIAIASGGDANAAAEAQEAVEAMEEAEEAARDRADAAADARRNARTLLDEATAFDAARVAAQAGYASGEFASASDAFAALIEAAEALAPSKPPKAPTPAPNGSLHALRVREARAALVALYGNRAACALRLGEVHSSHFHDAIIDCDAAIAATGRAADDANDAASAGEGDAPPVPPSTLKLRLRKLEARRRLGGVEAELGAELDELRQMAASDAERAAVEQLAGLVAGG